MPVKISPAEWEVLNVVWDRAPVTAPEVYQSLANEQDWHSKTVNTFLTRLVEKGILRARREGKANVYSPPTRQWYFDTNFKTKPPPGSLMVYSYVKGRWYVL